MEDELFICTYRCLSQWKTSCKITHRKDWIIYGETYRTKLNIFKVAGPHVRRTFIIHTQSYL
jgi:hypothetical protein